MQLLTSIKAVSTALLLSTIVAIDGIDLVQPATAQPTQGTLIARSARRRLSFRTGVRPSRYRVGGFSRSATCGNQELTAIVPPARAQEQVPHNAASVDKTTADHPTFFVYLPSLPAKTAQFTLQNEMATKQLHNVKFDLTGKPGIVGITLPASAPALQVGQKYVWQLAIACEPDDPASSIVVSSWVERVSPPTGSSSPTTLENRVTALAAQGVWQETLTLLARQRYEQPNDRDIAEDWAALMDDAGLPQFKQAAIVQMVTR